MAIKRLLCKSQMNDFATKAAKFIAQLRQLRPSVEPPQYFPSPLNFYRARMEFSLHHMEDGQLRYGMFDSDKSIRCFEVSEVPLRCISRLMPQLLRYLEDKKVLSHRLFQVNWRANLEGQVMLSLLYHCKLSDTWCQAAGQLASTLAFSSVLGRSKSLLLHVGPGFLDSQLPLEDGRLLHMRQSDTCFSQPNAYTHLDMLNWAQPYFQAPESDLLELHCGIGNFTCALAPNFRQVLATEVVRQSVSLCRRNVRQNGLKNITVARLSASETAEALAGTREFRRLAAIDLSRYRFLHLLLDPPRSGLDQPSRLLAMNFEHILYISCNPQELLSDLAFWQQQGHHYHIVASALFDQFPHTEHLEVGVVLRR